MTREREVITDIVDKLINNGTMDDLVVAVLEESLDSNFMELEKLCKRKYLEAHHWQDYADCLTFVQACLKVLRYYSTDNYEEQQVRANQYSLKITELF